MTITYDNSVYASNSSSPNCSASLTVGGSGATVIALVLGGNAGSYTVTCGGTAMTLIGTVITASGNNTYMYYLSGVGSGSKTISATTTTGAYNRSSIAAVSYLGVSSVDVSSWSVATGSGTTPTASTLTVGPNDYALSGFASMGNYTVSANVGTVRVTGYGLATQNYNQQTIVDQTGVTSAQNKVTTSQSSSWAVGSVRLVGNTNWTGSAIGTTTLTTSADGGVKRIGGATGNVQLSTSADGVRATSSGATGNVTLSSSADGVRTIYGSANETVFLTGTADGASGGGVAGHFTLTGAVDGYRTALSGGTETTTLSSSADGFVDGHISAAQTINLTSSADGSVTHIGHASLTIDLTGTADGADGHTGSVAGNFSLTGYAEGFTTGSVFGHFTLTGLADGEVTPGSNIGSIYGTGQSFTLPSKPNPQQLQAALYGPPVEAVGAAEYLWNESDLANPQNDQLEILVYDNEYNVVGDAQDYVSVAATWARNDTDTATLVLKGEDPIGTYAWQHTSKNVVPITLQTGALRWSGQVDTCAPDYTDGKLQWTLQCKGDWDWFNRILVWPNFALPIEVQFPKEAIYIGPAVSCLKAMIGEQVIRLQTGLWEIVNNIIDPAAWFATMMEAEGLLTPCAVIPTDPLLDTSKWIAISGRMDTCATLMQQVCKDDGLVSSATLWMPGDPQPTNWYTLTEPTICFDIKDRSGIVGPTGTILDGLIEDAVDLENSLLGNVLSPFLNPGNEYAPDGVNIAPALGVNFVPSWVFFDCDDPLRSGVKEFHAQAHAPLAWQIIGGGKSPTWVNNIINATLEFLLGSLFAAIPGISGVPTTLLDGVLDDVLLAFQLVENVERRQQMGRYGKPEFFTSTGSTAYTLSEFFALDQAMWDTRGYFSQELVFFQGHPYTLGVDLFIGSLVTWKFQNQIFTDYVDQISLQYDRTSRVITAQVGDNSAREAPSEALQRKLTGFEQDLQIALLSAN